MFRRLSLSIDRHGVIAAIVGSACGTAVALWSLGMRPVRTPAVQASPSAVITGPAPAAASPAQAMRATVADIAAASATTVSAPVPVVTDGQDVRQRARALAARPD